MKLGKTATLKFLDNTLGPLLCRLIGRIHFRMNPDRYPAPLDIHKVRRILVIRPGGIGDMVVLLPMLTHLTTTLPQAAITVVCEKRNQTVLAMAHFQGEVIAYDSLGFTFLKKLTRGHFDLAIDTEQFHHFSAIFGLLSRAPIRIGFNINPRRNPLYSHLVPYSPNESESEQFMRLLHPLPISKVQRSLQGGLEGTAYALPVALMQQVGLSSPSDTIPRYIAIHAGSSSPYKHWDAAKFVELCFLLITDMHVLPILVGGREDSAFATDILKTLDTRGSTICSMVGKLTLEETAGVLQHASAFLGLDSGLAHLAVALNRPTVVLFGPTDPAKWGTNEGHHKVIYKAVPCSPCALFGYFRPCNTFACMKLITVQDVVTALRQVV